MASPPPTERTRVQRLPARAAYERPVIEAILDEALFCHVGFVVDGQPYVIPAVHARVGGDLFLHGSAASRMLRTLAGGVPVCVTATLLDGLVLARSAFHHSLNYRSVVILGTATELADDDKAAALQALVEHVVPGRSTDVRPPSAVELRATRVLRVPLAEASAKIRTGPPLDDAEDLARPCWAGEVPLRLVAGAAIPDRRSPPRGDPPPPAVTPYRRPRERA